MDPISYTQFRLLVCIAVLSSFLNFFLLFIFKYFFYNSLRVHYPKENRDILHTVPLFSSRTSSGRMLTRQRFSYVFHGRRGPSKKLLVLRKATYTTKCRSVSATRVRSTFAVLKNHAEPINARVSSMARAKLLASPARPRSYNSPAHIYRLEPCGHCC